MKNNTIKLTLLVSLVGLVVALMLFPYLYSKKTRNLAAFQGTYLEHPRTVNPFHLTGINQKPFDNSSLKDHWTIVFFGFTHCGYLCPTTMAELGKMYRILEANHVNKLPQVVMISLDPDRDTLEKLGTYVTAFHNNFYGARGDEASIKLMTKEMGIAFAKVAYKNNKNPQEYDVQHSGALMLFNPNGELNAFFTTPHDADLIAKDYMLLVS